MQSLIVGADFKGEKILTFHETIVDYRLLIPIDFFRLKELKAKVVILFRLESGCSRTRAREICAYGRVVWINL
jgi:hypothetical protein